MYTESTKRDERSARGGGGGGGRFHRNSGRMGAPSNATILRLAGLDKHRWDNGRLKQLVALETRNGRGPSPGSGNFALRHFRLVERRTVFFLRPGFDRKEYINCCRSTVPLFVSSLICSVVCTRFSIFNIFS